MEEQIDAIKTDITTWDSCGFSLPLLLSLEECQPTEYPLHSLLKGSIHPTPLVGGEQLWLPPEYNSSSEDTRKDILHRLIYPRAKEHGFAVAIRSWSEKKGLLHIACKRGFLARKTTVSVESYYTI